MVRYSLILCAGLMVLPQAHAANATIYSTYPYSTVTSISTQTGKAGGFIPLEVSTGGLTLSADGKTFYSILQNQVVAIDVVTGKTLRTYQTENALWSSLALAPDESKIYVGTCSNVSGNQCKANNVEALDVASGQDLAVIPMGNAGVQQIVAAPNGAAVYAIHNNELTAIDVATLQAGASWTPQAPPRSLVISPESRYGYLLASTDETLVYKVDLARMTGAAVFLPPPTCYSSYSMALSGNGATLAVTAFCNNQNDILFIDTSTGAISQTVENVSGDLISIGSGGHDAYISQGSAIAVVNAATGSVNQVMAPREISAAIPSPDGHEIYLLFPANSAVEAFEEGATTVSKLFSVAWKPVWLALSPDGTTLYSAYSTLGNDGLEATSTVTGQNTNLLTYIFGAVEATAVSPDGESVYAITYPSNSLIIINTSTGAVENTLNLPVCDDYFAARISTAGNRIYMSLCGPTVAFNTNAQEVVAHIPGTGGPALAVSPKGGVLYVSALDGYLQPTSVDVVDTTTYQVTGTIPIAASAIAFAPDGATAYAVTSQNGVPGIAVIDTSTLAISDFISGINGSGGQSIAVTPDGKLLYVAGSPGAIIDAHSLTIVGQLQSGGPILIR